MERTSEASPAARSAPWPISLRWHSGGIPPSGLRYRLGFLAERITSRSRPSPPHSCTSPYKTYAFL